MLGLRLAFLTPGQKYLAHLYSDEDSVTTRTKVGIATRWMNSKTDLEAALKAGGGQAIWITPRS